MLDLFIHQFKNSVYPVQTLDAAARVFTVIDNNDIRFGESFSAALRVGPDGKSEETRGGVLGEDNREKTHLIVARVCACVCACVHVYMCACVRVYACMCACRTVVVIDCRRLYPLMSPHTTHGAGIATDRVFNEPSTCALPHVMRGRSPTGHEN